MSTPTSHPPPAQPALRRNTTVVLGVLVLHGAVLWALQIGLLRRVADVVLPAAIQVDILAPTAAAPAPQRTQGLTKQTTQRPTPPAAAQTPTATTHTTPRTPTTPSALAQPAPTPVATPQPVPSPLALAPSATAQPPAAPAALAHTGTSPSAQGSSHAPAAAPPAAPAPPKLELPSSDADYLNNARPAYPAASKRLRETGLVVVRVFIDTDGQASQASVKQSSGFERLDQTSVDTALKWRYVPGKRAGVPQGMWFDVPFHWQLTR